MGKPDDLISIDCLPHFEIRRKHYYLAETIHRKLRDSIKKNEDDCFDILEDEIETGIYRVSKASYSNPVERIDAITDRARGMVTDQCKAHVCWAEG